MYARTLTCLNLCTQLSEIWMQITKALGSTAPVITSFARGIIGNDAISEEFKEVNVCLLIFFD